MNDKHFKFEKESGRKIVKILLYEKLMVVSQRIPSPRKG